MHHHIYIDGTTGRWGDRSALVLVALTDDELERFQSLTDAQRLEQWGTATRYFGDVPAVRGPVRRHLAARDEPTAADRAGDAPPAH